MEKQLSLKKQSVNTVFKTMPVALFVIVSCTLNIMRVNSLYLIILISVLGTSFSYKLRRDISKVRHYCKEICTQCGGETALSHDVCVCSIEEAAEGEEIQQCLERARIKFDFLGIKLETDTQPVSKRSLYGEQHPSHGIHLYSKPGQEKRPLFKRLFLESENDNSANSEQKTSHDGDALEAGDKHRSKRSFNDYGNRFDITRIAEMFQPKKNNPIRPPTNFKILLGASKLPNFDHVPQYDMITQLQRTDDEDCSEDESESDESSDYTGNQIALGDELDLRRLGIHQNDKYELIRIPDYYHVDDSTVEKFNSIWDSVLSELFNHPDYFIPPNFAGNMVFA